MNFPPFLLPQEPETVLLRRTKAALHPAGSFRLSSLLTRSRKALPRLCRASGALLPRGTSVCTRPWTEWQPWQMRERGDVCAHTEKDQSSFELQMEPTAIQNSCRDSDSGKMASTTTGRPGFSGSHCCPDDKLLYQVRRNGEAATRTNCKAGAAHGTAADRRAWTGRLSTEVFQNRPTPGKQNLPLLRALPVFYRCRGAHEGDRREKNRYLSFTHVKLASPGPAGERQEHLDSITAFLGTGQRRSLFRALDTFFRFLLNAQLMTLTRELEATDKHLDDQVARLAGRPSKGIRVALGCLLYPPPVDSFCGTFLEHVLL